MATDKTGPKRYFPSAQSDVRYNKSNVNRKNSKKNTIFVFNKRCVTSMQKYPIIQYIVLIADIPQTG